MVLVVVGLHQSVTATGSALERSYDHQWKQKHVVFRTCDGLDQSVCLSVFVRLLQSTIFFFFSPPSTTSCLSAQLPADLNKMHLTDHGHQQMAHVPSSQSGCSIASDSGSSSLSDIYQVGAASVCVTRWWCSGGVCDL